MLTATRPLLVDIGRRCRLLLALALFVGPAAAQDLLIDGGRIVEGAGLVIERGYVLVRDGRIESIGAGTVPPAGIAVIDATGMTVIPGLIDAHWHLTVGAPARDDEAFAAYVDEVVAVELRGLLDRGVTTIMSAGDHFPQVMDIRERFASGAEPAPRLLVVGPVLTAPGDWPTQICRDNPYCLEHLNAEIASVEAARATVARLADSGVDAIKLVYDDRITPGVRIENELVAAIADEARARGLTLFVHVSTVEETGIDVVNLGAGRLVHPVPLRQSGGEDGARLLAEKGVAVATTVGAMSPEWSSVIGRQHTDELEADFRRRLEDIRFLHEHSVTIAFGTDTVAGPDSRSDRFFQAEVDALSEILSREAVLASLTSAAATYLERVDIGTIAAGKRADIAILAGNPLQDLHALSKVRVVIQGGKVVADHRP